MFTNTNTLHSRHSDYQRVSSCNETSLGKREFVRECIRQKKASMRCSWWWGGYNNIFERLSDRQDRAFEESNMIKLVLARYPYQICRGSPWLRSWRRLTRVHGKCCKQVAHCQFSLQNFGHLIDILRTLLACIYYSSICDIQHYSSRGYHWE